MASHSSRGKRPAASQGRRTPSGSNRPAQRSGPPGQAEANPQPPRSGQQPTRQSAPKQSAKPAERQLVGPVRLNRYIARSGVCARREADTYIQAGRVQVNGQVVTELATKVDAKRDEVLLDGQKLMPENRVYYLLNKPKNHITTRHDPEGRRTVYDLIKPRVSERVFPVGRLDRNTTGLLLLTNDGELAEKLAHPSHEIPKLYHIKLDRPVMAADLKRLAEGIELEDGPIRADAIDWTAEGGRQEVGVEIHSGRNRIVRRMFEHLGYQVKSLDRVGYAFLTKKGLPRGHWRKLTPQEVQFLRMHANTVSKSDKSSSGA